MRLSELILMPRRMLNSPYHPMKTLPKPDKWWKKQRIYKFSAWFYGDARDHYKPAFQHSMHSWKRQTRWWKNKDIYEAFFYRKRIDAALEEFNITFYLFDDVLKKLNIRLNLQMLHFLAIYEPRSFKSLAMLTKQVGLENQMDLEGTLKNPLPEGVITRGVL